MPQYRHALKGYLTINGVRRSFVEASVTGGPDTLVATANVQIDPREGIPSARDEVVIYGGTNVLGTPPVLFTGEVRPVQQEHFERTGQITCLDALDRARNKLGTAAGEDLTDIDGNPIPVLSRGAASEDGISITDGEWVKILLDAAGVPYDDASWEEAGWEVGAVLPKTLNRGEAPLDAIQKTDRDTHCITFSGRDGRARRIRFSGQPQGTPGLVYREGVNVEHAARSTGDRTPINRWNITGVASDVFTVSDTVEAPSRVNPNNGKPYVPDPPGYNAEGYQSDGLETSDQVIEWGTAELGRTNRLEEDVQVKLPVIAPNIAGGESVQLFYPTIGLGAGEVGWIGQVTHRMSASEFKTDFTMHAFYASEGVGTNIKPRASFVYMVLRKRVADGTTLYIVVCDASGSNDPDGAYELPPIVNEDGQEVPGTSHNGIALYQWSSSAGTLVSVADGGKRATFVFEGDPSGESITLRVYDFQGAFAEATRVIAFTDQNPVRVRDLWAAIQNDLLLTRDGEITWLSVGVPAVGCARYAADTYQIAWGEDGTAWRVTVDLSYTVIPVVGVTAAYITWSFPAQASGGRRAWLGTTTGEVWFSGDYGMTWEQRGTVPSVDSSITTIGESAYAENQLQATARNKLWQSFDGGATWVEVYAHPNINLIAFSADAGYGVGLVVFQGDPPATDPGAEASRIQERAGLIEGDWVRALETFDIPVGSWKVAYSYRGAGGETMLSPVATQAIGLANEVVRIAPLNPLPAGATGVYYYASISVGSSTLRRFAEGTGFEAVDLEAPAPVGGQLPPTENTTLQGVANPSAAPSLAPAGATSEADVDFPVQATAISLSHSDPIAYVTGVSQDGSDQIWTAQIDHDFTLHRATYDPSFNQPNDVVADQSIRGVAFGIAEGAIFQTIDDFDTTIYAAKLLIGGGELGLRLGLGALHELIVIGNLIWIAASEDRITRWVYRLTTFGIVRAAHPLSGVPAGNATSYANTNLFLLASDQGTLITYAGAMDPGRHATHATGVYRSTDGGVSWAAVSALQNCYAVAAGLGGVWYAACQTDLASVFNGHTLYRSDDDGATWDAVNSIGNSGVIATMYNALTIDPTDAMRVLIKSFGNTAGSSNLADNPRDLLFYLSSNGGVTFASLGAGAKPEDQAGIGRGPYAQITADGSRVVWYRQDTTARQPEYAPTTVGSSTKAFGTGPTSDDAFPITFDGTDMLWATDKGLLRSSDNGSSWAVELDSDVAPMLGSDYIKWAVPGNAGNSWYAFPDWPSQSIFLISRPDSDPTWIDLTPALVDTFGGDDFHNYIEAAVRIAEEE